MTTGKVYLRKREFVSKNKDDGTMVNATVRRYDYGGYDASYILFDPGGVFHKGGIEISCNPDSEESLASANAKIDDIIASLTEFQENINTAASDARKAISTAHKKGKS